MTSFSLFSGATLYFLLALLFARYSPFYLCPLLFSFAFLSPYSAYFGVLSNSLARFSGLALRRFSRCILWSLCLRINVQLYPDHFDFPLKTRITNDLICSRTLTSTSPCEALVLMLMLIDVWNWLLWCKTEIQVYLYFSLDLRLSGLKRPRVAGYPDTDILISHHSFFNSLSSLFLKHNQEK